MTLAQLLAAKARTLPLLCRLGLHRWKDHFRFRRVTHHIDGFELTSQYDHVGRRCTRCRKSVGVHAE